LNRPKSRLHRINRKKRNPREKVERDLSHQRANEINFQLTSGRIGDLNFKWWRKGGGTEGPCCGDSKRNNEWVQRGQNNITSATGRRYGGQALSVGQRTSMGGKKGTTNQTIRKDKVSFGKKGDRTQENQTMGMEKKTSATNQRHSPDP